VSLDEFAGSLHAALRDAEGQDRHRIEAALVWCKVERGELGDAFRLLWEPTDENDPGQVRRLTRAELQAYCGNEDAALALTDDLAEQSDGLAMVRARIASSRGDWDSAVRHARQAAETHGDATRALQVAARASIELGRGEDARRLLDRISQETPVDTWTVRAMRARLSDRDRVQALIRVADGAREQGAMRVCADAWADASRLCRAAGERDEMRKAAVRAVEIWDDMATSLPLPLRGGFWGDATRQAIRKASKRPHGSSAAPVASGLTPLLVTLRRLASERDLSKLLTVITDGAVSLSGAERGFVLLVDEHGALETRTIRGAESHLGEQAASFSRSIAETVLIDGEPVITVDAARDARVQDYMSVHRLMLKSVACLPIESRGRIWGVLYLEHRSASGRFAGTDLSLLRAYADQAAIAIETSELIGRIEMQKEHLERANQALRDANELLEQRLLGQTEALQRSRKEIAELQTATGEGERWGIIGASEGMRRVYEVLDRVSAREVPVALTGESGTGKEIVARAIHRGSPRSEMPYVSLHCGAIPEGLLESELFGHIAGAFTGAMHARDGVFRQADRGTLFMDEIADMPPRMQLDLLRVLQERCVRPIGADDDQAVDVRVITASKRPLRELVEEGTLREDLYYRLAVVEIALPPLRERRSDIPLLCDHFLERVAEARAERKKRLSRAALQRLSAHNFPGNVRELEHLLVNATLFAAGDTIEADELSIDTDMLVQSSSAGASDYRNFKDTERGQILATLHAHGWNRAKAARALGIARRTFYRRLKEHGIELPGGSTKGAG